MCLLILESEERGERERETWKQERNIDRLPLLHTPMGDGTRNLGMCPDQGSDPQDLVYRTVLQPTEPPSQGLIYFLLVVGLLSPTTKFLKT